MGAVYLPPIILSCIPAVDNTLNDQSLETDIVEYAAHCSMGCWTNRRGMYLHFGLDFTAKVNSSDDRITECGFRSCERLRHIVIKT